MNNKKNKNEFLAFKEKIETLDKDLNELREYLRGYFEWTGILLPKLENMLGLAERIQKAPKFVSEIGEIIKFLEDLKEFYKEGHVLSQDVVENILKTSK